MSSSQPTLCRPARSHEGLPIFGPSTRGLSQFPLSPRQCCHDQWNRYVLEAGESTIPDRGLIVPLSAKEEIALRRVAGGLAHPGDLQPQDLHRLITLGLIEIVDGIARLTPLDVARHGALP
jgi:hypothetical protein